MPGSRAGPVPSRTPPTAGDAWCSSRSPVTTRPAGRTRGHRSSFTSMCGSTTSDRRAARARPGRGPARGTCRARERNLPGLRRPGRTPVLSRAARNHLNRGAFILGRPRPLIRSPTRRAPRRGPHPRLRRAHDHGSRARLLACSGIRYQCAGPACHRRSARAATCGYAAKVTIYNCRNRTTHKSTTAVTVQRIISNPPSARLND